MSSHQSLRSLIITGDFPPHLGGIGDYSEKLALAMNRLPGVVCDILTTNDGRDDNLKRPFKVMRQVPAWTFSNRSAILDVIRQYDCVNIQYPGVAYGRKPLINLLPGLIRMQASHVASTVTIHDFRVMSKQWRLRTWPMLNAVNGVVYVDGGDWPVIQKWIQRPGGVKHVCVPIASNVDVLTCSVLDRHVWRSELNIEPDEVAVAYFGVIYLHKGLDELFDAVEKVRQRTGRKIRTVVLGDFDRDEPWVHVLAKRIQTEPSTTWVRQATLEQVSKGLHASDMSALPFHSGTSINRSSMLAALAHGLPTVTTRGHVTPKNILDQFDLLLVEPKNVEQLAGEIERLVLDDRLREHMRASSLLPHRQVTWDAVARKTADFFTSLKQSSTKLATSHAAAG
jgi:polysaccharide biosynthesis protein PslF